ncbi:hypothetical protein [Enterococcus sp. AZ051]|uniref:hypothetical protein n=1 Tax=Enterococcus sp. AZ051 TaxID=2774698 RepID=UPI003D266EDB
MIIRKYGEDSDVVRVRIYGDFPKGSLDSFISLEIVEFARNIKIPLSKIKSIREGHIGVDVARFGDDSTIIFPRIGPKGMEFSKYNKQDTMATTGNVIRKAKDMLKEFPHLKRIVIKVDDTGVGGGVTDRLREVVSEDRLPFEIVPVNNGESSSDDYYANKGTEIWGDIREMLEKNVSNSVNGLPPEIEIPDNPTLIKELSTRKFKMTSSGKIRLESKEDMKKRNVGSPDIADALTLAFYVPPTKKATFKEQPDWLQRR